ncbi:MAG: hypothetical protein FJY82_03310 [Candidatus Aminicenantes bacterium]|nr:hypothetical protein [Candidatus Aminicenantes bacterium]
MKRIMPLIVLAIAFPGQAATQDCPKQNVIQSVVSDMPSFKEVSPLDFGTIRSAKAWLSRGGKKLNVLLSNGDFSAEAMANDYVLPLKTKSEFILVVTFLNGDKPIVEGDYSPAAGYGKPFWAFAEIRVLVGPKGTNVSFGVIEGSARLLSMKNGRVCGTFNLAKKNAKNEITASVVGEFNVEMEMSKF